jgi:dihydroxyacetone kinase-like predicted kinase
VALPRLDLESGAHETFGFCTEFLVEQDGPPIDVERLRAEIGLDGNRSVVVVGDGAAAHVHVHSDHPEQTIDAAGAFGRVRRAKVEDMSRQSERFRAEGSGAGRRLAMLALSPGAGFDAVFAELGASTMPMGSGLKASAGEIATAADALRSADVVVLPNHVNLLMPARQAAEIAGCTLHVVATRNLAEGIAAAFAFDESATVEASVGRLNEARSGVHCVEVTTAAADRSADGVRVSAGQSIVLVDGALRAAGHGLLDLLVEGLRLAGAGAGATVTVYLGEGAPSAEPVAERLEDALEADVQVLPGGQKLYPFIASVE